MDGNKVTVVAAVIAAFGTIVTALGAGTSAYYSAGIAANGQRLVAETEASSKIQIAQIEKQNSDRQSDIEMVKLALNILGGDISDKTHESRQFAVSLLQKYSGVEINASSSKAWAETGTVKFSNTGLGLSSIVQLSDQTAAAISAMGLIEDLQRHYKIPSSPN